MKNMSVMLDEAVDTRFFSEIDDLVRNNLPFPSLDEFMRIEMTLYRSHTHEDNGESAA